jgi:thymidylate synthase (FAD)
MYLVKPGWKTIGMGITPWDKVNGLDVLKTIEMYGRKCYKTEGKATEYSAIPFMAKRMQQGHIALLDHLHITAEYVCDRGVSHEWLRHKLTEIFGSNNIKDEYDWAPMAVCQESTRYCNYMKSGGVVFIIPPWVNIAEGEYPLGSPAPSELWSILSEVEQFWFMGKQHSEYIYLQELKLGWTPQQARGDLAIAVKTDFVVTCSLTEWRHIFQQRTSFAAHPQMRELMVPQLQEFKSKIPVIFDDISI